MVSSCSLRDGLLAEWVEKLPLLEEPLKKDYIPKSFLRAAAPGCVASVCYKDVSLAIEPLMRLPFAVDMFYEFRKPCTSTEDMSSAYPTESPSPAPQTVRDTLSAVSEEVNADVEIDTGEAKTSDKSQPTAASSAEGVGKTTKPGWFKNLNFRCVCIDTYTPPYLMRCFGLMSCCYCRHLLHLVWKLSP